MLVTQEKNQVFLHLLPVISVFVPFPILRTPVLRLWLKLFRVRFVIVFLAACSLVFSFSKERSAINSATLAFSFIRADCKERNERDERDERDLADRLSDNLSKLSLILASHSRIQLVTSLRYSKMSLSLSLKYREAISLSCGVANSSYQPTNFFFSAFFRYFSDPLRFFNVGIEVFGVFVSLFVF